MARGLPVAALVGALLSAGAMLLLQRQDVRVESGLVNGATETKVAQPLAEVAPARTAAADSAVPFVKTAPPTPLITVTDLVSPVGADATVESFAAWVTQSR